MGYKKPKLETAASIEKSWAEVSKKYATHYVAHTWRGDEADSVLAPKVQGAFNFYNQFSSGLCLFDKYGHKMDIYGEKVCVGKLDDFIPRLNPKTSYDSVDDHHLSHYIRNIADKDAQRIVLNIDPAQSEYDYYAILPWCIWLGNTRKDVKFILKLLEKRNDLKIKILPVNTDIRDTWPQGETIAKNTSLKFKREKRKK
ncbi:MAG: hypothetical protein EAZ57_07735 [Cytophagales bacterium]|nr:MAG: hypothetical protein EAZ67_08820 [Cytophagales bacterium]TAF60428.1 MAG: hypothetical protein EAZ57_07735 [Cytophagales bacterium]